jgi:superfamily II DNA or RNA helicase
VGFTAGNRVIVRGERWVVEEATAFADVTELDLSRMGAGGSARRCKLLVPFDRPVICDRAPRIRAVTARQWAHHLRAHLSERRIHGQLHAAERAAINILPFQLEPALALIQGRASRFLLADEVGLGKTIQAGLMLAELRRRGWCDRALILTPSGLRQQWADELRSRFDIPSRIIDAATLAALTGSLPFDANPWTIESVVITSIDFIKQAEVLRALAPELWDLVIVDEAHQAAVASLRHQAVQTIAARARHVVLVTATPHAGDEKAYEALCGLGQLDDRELILLFRRTREKVGLSRTRRAHLLAVTSTPEAIELHRLLDAYLVQLWQIAHDTRRHDAQLVAMVLAKRAFSSAHSLVVSLERRVAGLVNHTDQPAQAMLPFDADTDMCDEPLIPVRAAFERVEDERAVLQRLIESARRVQTNERTLDTISAAVGEVRRVAMLHGGQPVQERREAISAFTHGAADLLLATDAGSEGLNLQSNCRLVVNLELPWNPIRLEQRIGRVDRIGQTRTVHAINLFAAGTAEGDVLARLQQRLERIRMSEIEIAACVINRSELVTRPSHDRASTTVIDLREAAHSEARRIKEARTVAVEHTDATEFLVPVTALRPRPVKRLHVTRSCLIAFMRVRLATRAGRLIEDTLLPISVPFKESKQRLRRRDVRATAEALLSAIRPQLVRVAQQHALIRAKTIEVASAECTARAVDREHRISRRAAIRATPLVQAGLFDTRAVRQQLECRTRDAAIEQESVAHTNLLEAGSEVCLASDPQIALLLFG